VARRFEYSVTVTSGPLEADPEWAPEHLVLAGLGRCTLKSLEFHAGHASASTSGTAAAAGVVTKRESDGRYALVEVECGLDVEIEPAPEGGALLELLALAERDCFVGASLTVRPQYEWRVNGEVVSP
jgi:organic hydroperoxide reductase OsmC/OhrA